MENYFSSFPDTARVWVYQADRAFSPYEVQSLTPALKQFAQQWTAHKLQLRADAAILHQHFIVLVVDEEMRDASGCSIDSSVKVIKEIGDQLKIDFFNRLNALHFSEGNYSIYTAAEMQNALKEGVLTANSLVFNNLVNSLGELRSEWLLPLEKTWMKRYLTAVKA